MAIEVLGTPDATVNIGDTYTVEAGIKRLVPWALGTFLTGTVYQQTGASLGGEPMDLLAIHRSAGANGQTAGIAWLLEAAIATLSGPEVVAATWSAGSPELHLGSALTLGGVDQADPDLHSLAGETAAGTSHSLGNMNTADGGMVLAVAQGTVAITGTPAGGTVVLNTNSGSLRFAVVLIPITTGGVLAPAFTTSVSAQMRLVVRSLRPDTGTEIAAGFDSLALAGQSAGISLAKHIAGALDTLELAEQAAGVKVSKNIAAGTAALTLSAQAAALTFARHITAALAQLTVAEQSAAVRLSKAVMAQAAGLAIAEQPATLGNDITIAAEVAELALAEFAASVRRDTAVQASVGELTLAEPAAVVNRGRVIAAAAAALEVAEQLASVNRGTRIDAAAAALLLEERAGTVALAKAIAAALATLEIDELEAAVGLAAFTQLAVAQVMRVLARDDALQVAPRQDSAIVQPRIH